MVPKHRYNPLRWPIFCFTSGHQDPYLTCWKPWTGRIHRLRQTRSLKDCPLYYLRLQRDLPSFDSTLASRELRACTTEGDKTTQLKKATTEGKHNGRQIQRQATSTFPSLSIRTRGSAFFVPVSDYIYTFYHKYELTSYVLYSRRLKLPCYLLYTRIRGVKASFMIACSCFNITFDCTYGEAKSTIWGHIN